MAKASAQADLDAALSKKPDTSEADALRKELQSIKDQHQAALMTAQQESAQATDEHLETKKSLQTAREELEKHKAEAAAKHKSAESDYLDMHDSMTQLVEEANKKNTDLEARTKELEANLKVKDAELAEAKVSVPFSPQFLFIC